MILVTGATGFIGRVLVRQLSESGFPLRALIRPSPRTPRLPKGVPLEVARVEPVAAQITRVAPQREAIERLCARPISGLSLPDEALRRENLYEERA